uniref:adenosine deaminase n=1 Tax=Tetraselmis chuii TaxID=63592 RepID=A0A7S1SV99_9CHLO|mmetsp:Transcript_27435/g.48886  ORF Transcript_27435/g.48886 Transcript_27435/m.48886 type:complete len:353 (+) Transcript_27435:281-1339(+)
MKTEESNRQWVTRQPKADLHRHIEGGVRPETIWRLQTEGKVGFRFSSLSALKKKVSLSRPVQDWHEFFNDFGIFQRVFTEGGPKATLAAVREEVEHAAEQENIDLLELRFSPQFMNGDVDAEQLRRSLKGRAEYPSAWDDHMEAIIQGCVAGSLGRDMKVGLMPLVSRNYGPASGMMTVAFARRWRPHVVGFDFAADESKSMTTQFAESAAAAHQLGLPLTVHTGEGYSSDYITHTLDTYGSAVRRLGHAVTVLDDPELVRRCRRDGITVECCPTSNYLMGTIPSLRAHPLPRMIASGLRVCVNTDDPSLFGLTLNQEWENCLNSIHLSRPQLLRMNATARASSFITANSFQ